MTFESAVARRGVMLLVLIGCLSAVPARVMSAQLPTIARPSPQHALVRLTPGVDAMPDANRRLLHDSVIRRRSASGGVIGFVVGAAAGALVGCMANRDDYGVFCGGQSDTRVVFAALVGGAVGALIGSRYF